MSRIILIRHAEALHNETKDWSLPDPPLTDKGIQQCKDLQAHLLEHCPLASQANLIICSPLRRTVQTTLTALQWLVHKGVPVELDAMWQENSHSPCDTGSDLNEMAEHFPELNFSSVDPIFPDKSNKTKYAFTHSAVRKRGQACLKHLFHDTKGVVIVVSHSAFLRTAISECRYANADYRVFAIGADSDGNVRLIEDASTQSSGGGMGLSRKGRYPAEEWEFPA